MTFPTTATPTVSSDTANTTAKTVTIPAHSTGDVIMLLVGADGDNTLSSITALNGAAWTVGFTSGIDQNAISAHMAWVRATSDQATSTTVTTNWTDTEATVHHAYVLGNVETGREPNGIYAWPGSISTSWDPPSHTAPWGSDDNLWFTGAAYDAGSGLTTIDALPAGYTTGAITNQLLSSGVSFATGFRESAAATENPAAGTANEAEQFWTFTVAVGGGDAGGAQSQPITEATESDAALSIGVSQTFLDPTFVVGLGFQP